MTIPTFKPLPDYEAIQANIGKQADVTENAWTINVIIKATRIVFGRVEYQVVQPSHPDSKRWVSASKVSF